MATLARALDFPMVVRPPEGNREWITRLLDAGVWNLHVPAGGHAGAGGGGRLVLPLRSAGRARHVRLRPHTEYRTLPRRAHGRRERPRARHDHAARPGAPSSRLDEIAAVPGIDALTLGPTDLAQNLGVLGTPTQRPGARRASPASGGRRRASTARRWPMITDSVEGVRQMIALGATIINYSSDAAALRSGLRLGGRGNPSDVTRYLTPDPERAVKAAVSPRFRCLATWAVQPRLPGRMVSPGRLPPPPWRVGVSPRGR